MPRPNTQMFALPHPPPEALDVLGRPYRLARVYKHDFFAATCLYERADGGDWPPPRIVVKHMRRQQFFGLGAVWLGRLLAAHEEAIYRELVGVAGVPRWVARLGETAFAIEHVEAAPLDHVSPPPGFFDALRHVLDAVHDRGVGYCDMNKRSNVLVSPSGRPYLIDFQISIRRRDELPWPLRAIVRRAVEYVQHRDVYHLYKHKRRMAPSELTPQEDALSRNMTLMHRLHRRATDPWRMLRRWFLRRQHRKGSLVSPSEALEDHHQPEKATWRK